MKPKGQLVIIGGAEDKGDKSESPELANNNEEILRTVLPYNMKRRTELITTGSKAQDEVKKKYQEAFKRVDSPNIGFIEIENVQDARNESYIKRIEKATAVFFTGGDQFRLSTILGGTPIVEIVRDRYEQDPDFLVAGTSAGAMVMSKIMISEGGKHEALLKGDVKTTSGFGLLDYCIVDTHFIKRGRFGRLAQAIITNPGQLGLGLGEDTALLIKNGSE